MQSLKHTASCCIAHAGYIFLELCVHRSCGFLHLGTILSRYSSSRSWRHFCFLFRAAVASDLLQSGSRLSRGRNAVAAFFFIGLALIRRFLRRLAFIIARVRVRHLRTVVCNLSKRCARLSLIVQFDAQQRFCCSQCSVVGLLRSPFYVTRCVDTVMDPPPQTRENPPRG